MDHIKHNITPIVAQTFTQGLADSRKITKNNAGSYIVTAYKLGEININEDIGDTTQFLRQITAAIYPTTNGVE